MAALDQQLLKVEEVAMLLNLSKSGIYSLVALRKIPFIKLGGALRFDRPALEKWTVDNSFSARPK